MELVIESISLFVTALGPGLAKLLFGAAIQSVLEIAYVLNDLCSINVR